MVRTEISLFLKNVREELGKLAKTLVRKSEEKHATLVENSLTGIFIDQDGTIVFANNRLAEIYGYPREELIGIQSRTLVHPEDRPLTDKMRVKRLKGEDAPSEYVAKGLTKAGETIWIRRRNTDIEYQGRPAILGNAVDVTEQKRAEQQLRKKTMSLRTSSGLSPMTSSPPHLRSGILFPAAQALWRKTGEEGKNLP
jgi:PAS domain S-box-containing protein